MTQVFIRKQKNLGNINLNDGESYVIDFNDNILRLYFLVIHLTKKILIKKQL